MQGVPPPAHSPGLPRPHTSPPGARQRESGQALVESAIVLPLFVFLILGLLQLGLMHQARLLTKYAAYKAVRAGALHHADVKKMERAALAVLLPVLSRSNGGGAEHVRSVLGPGDFEAKWAWPEVRANQMPDADMKLVEVTICGPWRGDFSSSAREIDFDDPAMATAGREDWQKGQRTKLRIQVTLNYRMPIPFANRIIHSAAWARTIPEVLLMGTSDSPPPRKAWFEPYLRAADKGLYIHPIRATYTMRMQSNFLPGTHPLPESNACIFAF
jgi:hypothetical protein